MGGCQAARCLCILRGELCRAGDERSKPGLIMNVQQVGAILSGGAPSRSQSLRWTLPPRPAPLSLSLFSHSLSIFSCTLKSHKENPSQEAALIFLSIKTQYTHTCTHMLIYTGPPLTAPFSRQETFDLLFLLNSRVPRLIGYQFCGDSGQLGRRLSASLLCPFEAIVPLGPLLVPTSDAASLIFCRPSQRSISQIGHSQCSAMMENCWYAFNLLWLKADQTTPEQGICSCLIPLKWNCCAPASISLRLRDCWDDTN